MPTNVRKQRELNLGKNVINANNSTIKALAAEPIANAIIAFNHSLFK